jgi:hypothetical protein
VAELEQENISLRALTQNGNNASSHPKSDEKILAEMEQLRAQLAAAEKRQSELSAELERQTGTRCTDIKVESAESQFSPSPTARSTPTSTPHKTGASLGLMVCKPYLLLPVHKLTNGDEGPPVCSAHITFNADSKRTPRILFISYLRFIGTSCILLCL